MPMPNSGFRWEVDENRALQGYYSESSANLLPTFRVILSITCSGLKTTSRFSFQDGTDRLSWNVEKELTLNAA